MTLFNIKILLNFETAKYCDVMYSPVKQVRSNVNGCSDKPAVKFDHIFLFVLSGTVVFD